MYSSYKRLTIYTKSQLEPNANVISVNDFSIQVCLPKVLSEKFHCAALRKGLALFALRSDVKYFGCKDDSDWISYIMKNCTVLTEKVENGKCCLIRVKIYNSLYFTLICRILFVKTVKHIENTLSFVFNVE